MTHNILVTGGTGKTGSRVVKRLTEQGHHVRVGSRKESPAFDWDDPTTYAEALKGMDRAYIVYYPDLAVPGAKEAIAQFAETALREGLEKVVLLSGKGEQEAEACEEIVANSGLNYTLVRASWFNQNFSESFFLEPVLAGHVALPMPDAQIPFVDAEDIADIVTKVLLDDSYNSETITVTGPRQLNFGQAIAEIAEATDRTIGYQPVTVEMYSEAMQAAGVPGGYVWLLTYLFREVLGNPNNQELSQDVERVLGRPATDFSTFVHRVAATGLWNEPVPQSI